MPQVERRDRSGWALAGAVALHVLAFVLVRHTRHAQPVPAVSRAVAHEELAVELVPVVERTAAPEPAGPPVRRAAPATPFTAPRVEASVPEVAIAAESVPEAPEPVSPPARSGAQAVDLGIGPDAWQRWAQLGKEGKEGKAAPSTPRAGRYELPRLPPMSQTGGLQEGLEQRDRELGLSASGRVISAFHSAAHASVAPELGTASFNVTVLRTGAVEISVGAASGDVDKWRAVAVRATEELERKPPRISSARNGMRVVIDITAEETYPNGLNPKDRYGPRLEARLPSITSADDAKKQLEAQNPTTGKSPYPGPDINLNVELPGVYITQRGKVCGYRAGLTPFGPVIQGGCDPSNLGSKPQRIVRAKARDEAMF